MVSSGAAAGVGFVEVSSIAVYGVKHSLLWYVMTAGSWDKRCSPGVVSVLSLFGSSVLSVAMQVC